MEKESSVLDRLLQFYEPCFDLKRPFAVGETLYDAYAFCDVTSSKYVLVEKAELWRAYTCFFSGNRYVFPGRITGI